MVDLEEKKVFLYGAALLYHLMIELAHDDVLRRHLAFRIIVNTVSFEDLIAIRAHPRVREIRDALLSRNSQVSFFEHYDAADEIRDCTVRPLLHFMRDNLSLAVSSPAILDLTDHPDSAGFRLQIGTILRWYHKMHIAGAQMDADLLWRRCEHIGGLAPKSLAVCLYRYHTSKALLTLAMYLISGLRYEPACAASILQAKLDVVLHGVNMADCALQDVTHPPFAAGMREILRRGKLGNSAPFEALAADSKYQSQYVAARKVCDEIAGRVDWSAPLRDLLNRAAALELEHIYEMVGAVDRAVCIGLESVEGLQGKYGAGETCSAVGPDSTWPAPKPYY